MRNVVSVSVVALVLLSVTLTLDAADPTPPTVNIYTQNPVEFGKPNTLICHCNNFHPPRLNMTLMKNGKAIEKCDESDLSFGQDWKYHKTLHSKFIPQDGESYECLVQHAENKPQTYRLEIF